MRPEARAMSARSESESSDSDRPLIVGLGNVLLRDDGVGVHAVRAFRDDPALRAVEVGTFLLDALHLFEDADRILAIDAMAAGGRPGTIYQLDPQQVRDEKLRGSLHGFGLLEALRLLPDHRPDVVILGVEPERIEYGLELTSPVAAALPRLLGVVRQFAVDPAG